MIVVTDYDPVSFMFTLLQRVMERAIKKTMKKREELEHGIRIHWGRETIHSEFTYSLCVREMGGRKTRGKGVHTIGR